MYQFAVIKWPFIFLILPLILGGIFGLFIGTLIVFVILYFFASLLYGLYPLFLRTEKLYLKMGYTNVIFEYQLIKKLLIVLIPFLVIDTIFDDILHITTSFYENYPAMGEYLALLLLVSAGALLRIMTQIGKKDYRLYFAKGCCKIISEKEDCLEKMRYLRLLLASYDRYLKRRVKVGIDQKKIYSIILYKNPEERNQIINSICESLEGDKLSLAKYLSSIHKVPDSEFYIEESFLQQLKPIAVFLATAIPIIVSVVALLMRTE